MGNIRKVCLGQNWRFVSWCCSLGCWRKVVRGSGWSATIKSVRVRAVRGLVLSVGLACALASPRCGAGDRQARKLHGPASGRRRMACLSRPCRRSPRRRMDSSGSARTGGLLRFDGSRFVTYERGNTPAFHENSVFSLMTARDGTLWIGTDGGGLVRMRDGHFRTIGAADGLLDGFVRATLEDETGAIWIGNR